MMAMTLTPEARAQLDSYLQLLRRSLRGTSVDADEIEQDVRDHIDAAFASAQGPVSPGALEEVLGRLGRPDQWVPEEELPTWRRTLNHLLSGPEDWRLPYLCFALTLLGLVTVPIGGIVLLVGAYFLGRATIDLVAQRDEPLGARRWLVYPPLVFFAAALTAVLLLGPVAPLGGLIFEEGTLDGVLERYGAGLSMPWARAAIFVAALGVWWVLLAALAAFALRPLRTALHPLAARLRRRHTLYLALIGATLVAISAIVYTLR